jgi:hypothetical protein
MTYYHYDHVLYRDSPTTGHLERWLDGEWRYDPANPMSEEEFHRMRPITAVEAAFWRIVGRL